MRYKKERNDWALRYEQNDLSLQISELSADYAACEAQMEQILFPAVVRKRMWRARQKNAFERWLDRRDKRFYPVSIVLYTLCAAFCLALGAQTIYCVTQKPQYTFLAGDFSQGSVSESTSNADEAQSVPFTVAVNLADIAELSLLPGIGQKTAEAIIAERSAHGSFFYPEDLLAVSGIGEKKLSAIRPYLTFEKEQTQDTSALEEE